MKNTTKNSTVHRCHECGSAMAWETRTSFVEYRGRRREYDNTGWWCTKCGEGVLEGEELKKGFTAAADLRAEVDGVLTPAQVRAVRTKLRLSPSDAARALGGGPKAFYKYETGSTPPSVPMSHLLRLLDHDPRRLAELPAFSAQRARPQARRGRPVTAGRRPSRSHKGAA